MMGSLEYQKKYPSGADAPRGSFVPVGTTWVRMTRWFTT